MFSSSPNYTKLKTNLRLAIHKLRMLEKKKTEITQKARREIAEFLANGKAERAKIRVEHIILEDYLVEAMEIVEMYCELLLARFGYVTNMKELDGAVAEAVSTLIWVAPRLQSDCQMLKIIGDLLSEKYGPAFAESCRNESATTISPKLKQKLSIQSPPKLLVEQYVIEIAKSFNIAYEPDKEVFEKGHDGVLIDLSDKNNLGGAGGGMPQPPGFVGFPQPPPLPNFEGIAPFTYPPKDYGMGMSGPSAPPASFSYNIPPGDDNKESNTDFTDNNLPTYSMVYPDIKKDNFNGDQDEDNLENSDDKPKPTPRTKFNDYNLPELPSVPSNAPEESSSRSGDIDFDDLTRRFTELKKRN